MTSTQAAPDWMKRNMGRRTVSGRWPNPIRGVLLGLGAAACGVSLGCGGAEGRVPVFPAGGKVTVGGEVPEGALVILYPAKAGGENELRPRGTVKADGSFKLTTYDAEDGAPAGDYSATIAWNKLIKRGSDFVAGPNIVPPQYASKDASPWKIQIKEGSNELPEQAITIKK